MANFFQFHVGSSSEKKITENVEEFSPSSSIAENLIVSSADIDESNQELSSKSSLDENLKVSFSASGVVNSFESLGVSTDMAKDIKAMSSSLGIARNIQKISDTADVIESSFASSVAENTIKPSLGMAKDAIEATYSTGIAEYTKEFSAIGIAENTIELISSSFMTENVIKSPFASAMPEKVTESTPPSSRVENAPETYLSGISENIQESFNLSNQELEEFVLLSSSNVTKNDIESSSVSGMLTSVNGLSSSSTTENDIESSFISGTAQNAIQSIDSSDIGDNTKNLCSALDTTKNAIQVLMSSSMAENTKESSSLSGKTENTIETSLSNMAQNVIKSFMSSYSVLITALDEIESFLASGTAKNAIKSTDLSSVTKNAKEVFSNSSKNTKEKKKRKQKSSSASGSNENTEVSSFLSSSELDDLNLLKFPSDVNWSTTLILRCDPKGGPYSISDVCDELNTPLVQRWVFNVGHTFLNHVFTFGFQNSFYLKSFLNYINQNPKYKIFKINNHVAKFLHIPNTVQTVTVYVKNIPLRIGNLHVAEVFKKYGTIIKIEWVTINEPGWYHVYTNERKLTLSLHDNIQVQDIPYGIKVKGLYSSVLVEQRSPKCLECYYSGHKSYVCDKEHCILYQKSD